MMTKNLAPRARSCYKCGYFGNTADKTCPKCSRPLHSTTETRIRGGLMAVCGLVILGIIGPISFWMIDTMNNPVPGRARFNGTEQQKLGIFGLFGMLLIFGVGATLIGGGQLLIGRRNRVISWIAVGFAVLIFVAAGAFIATFR